MTNPPSHVYYDLSQINNTTSYQKAILYENRATALMKDPSKFHLSIIKFLIPTSYLPIFIYPYNSSNMTAINTTYSVTIRYLGVDYRQYITYVAGSTGISSSDERYFYIYSYQQFIDMINTAFNAAYTALKTAVPGASVSSPPYMTFNPTTGLFSLIAEIAYATGYGVYMNSNLYSFFDNFDSIYNVGATNGKDYQILVKNNGNNSVTVVPPGYSSIASYEMIQEYSSTFLWNDVRTLVFTSNLLGVRGEAFNIISSNVPNTGSSYRNILTDFDFNVASFQGNSTLRSYVQYAPLGEYRLIDIINTSPLFQLDIQIYFQTQDSMLHELYIAPSEYISMKLLFRDREFKSGL